MNRKNPNDKYTGKILRNGIPGKRRAKAIETRLIRGFFMIFGKRTPGNKSWH
ncbi:hypothetical protein [Micromonospora sp. NBC_01796]|uniref:hypothetical protein n=1 Tax=Micromonospora sp. NBC_01796 TaxID=2975987 RepID=UPI003FA3719F